MNSLHMNGQTPAPTPQERLAALKARAEQARDAKARAEATLEQLNRQREEVLKELEALGVSEEGLDAEIRRLEDEVERALAEAERLLAPATEAATPAEASA